MFADDSEINAKHVHRRGLHHLVAMAAVAFTGDGMTRYSMTMRNVRTHLGVPTNCELKWSPANGSWLKTPEGNRARPMLRRAMLHAAIEAGARSVTVIYDRTGDEPVDQVRAKVMRYLYDKVSLHLANSGGKALMIADEPGGGGEARRTWLAASRELTQVGTPFTAPEWIGLPIMACPSDHLEHLQLADLIAGATTAAVAGNPHALELRDDLAQLADRNRAGRLGGAGVTLWPPRLVDLYWWLWDEPLYGRRGYLMKLGPQSAPMSWRTFQTSPGV
ncbi:hypothetical protein [Micromonospora sp. NPDC049107]|uniref:hypothetical protein n=1 Tax=unclassified Micromonospora TaxID=2617518 RepID=UPI0033C55A93